MDKATFHARLKEIPIQEHRDFRPFLCHGHPFEAEVFIIGLNPANPDLPKWWNYWNAEVGFDFDGFENVNRKENPKKSPTREGTESFIEGLSSSLKWIETNLYAIASDREKALRQANKNSDLNLLDTSSLDLLLEACRPKVIFVHGRAPCKYLGKKAAGNIDLRRIKFTTPVGLTLYDYETLCYPLRNHLAYTRDITEMLKGCMLMLGQKIRSELSE